jgi:hypothetical protein
MLVKEFASEFIFCLTAALDKVVDIREVSGVLMDCGSD